MASSSRQLSVLLVRPRSPNDRFGLGPFFRVEPLGLLYIAAVLGARGHRVGVVDERYERSLAKIVTRFRPDVVGISCMHTVDIPSTIAAARTVARVTPTAKVVVGGHVPSLFPDPFFVAEVHAVGVTAALSCIANLFEHVRDAAFLPPVVGAWTRVGAGTGKEHFHEPRASVTVTELVDEPLPARHFVERYRRRYLCVHKQPLWAIETARGCPYRCNFCSTSLLSGRNVRFRAVDDVVTDFRSVGKNIFIVDDLFFYSPERSLELAHELRRCGLNKDWILVQTRLDTVARRPDVLEAWRPLARHFDLFFGFEASSNEKLGRLDKDMDVAAMRAGVAVARRYDFGVTGNFVVDPDWEQADFEALYRLVDELRLTRLGYTVLTPLPGTPLYQRLMPRLVERDWSKWDMHHVLYEPRLGRRRFFELFVQSWRRNVLSQGFSPLHLAKWLRGLGLSEMIALVKILIRTRRILDVEAYLDETFPLQIPADVPGRIEQRAESTVQLSGVGGLGDRDVRL